MGWCWFYHLSMRKNCIKCRTIVDIIAKCKWQCNEIIEFLRINVYYCWLSLPLSLFLKPIFYSKDDCYHFRKVYNGTSKRVCFFYYVIMILWSSGNQNKQAICSSSLLYVNIKGTIMANCFNHLFLKMKGIQIACDLATR